MTQIVHLEFSSCKTWVADPDQVFEISLDLVHVFKISSDPDLVRTFKLFLQYLLTKAIIKYL